MNKIFFFLIISSFFIACKRKVEKVKATQQDITESVVFGEETLTAYLLGEAAGARIEVLDDVDVVHVVRAHLDYFEAIGAVGPSASSTDL